MHSAADLMFLSLVATAIAALPCLLSYALLSVALWWISRRRERGFEHPARFFAPRGYSRRARGMLRMNAPPSASLVLHAVDSNPQNSGEKAA